MEEKRKFSRVPFRIETLINLNNETFKGEVVDLSLKGMFVKTPVVVELSQTLQFSIYLTGVSSELSLNLSGDIVRQTADGFGVRFGPIDLDSFIHLKNIITYNSANADKVVDEFMDYVKENLESRNTK